VAETFIVEQTVGKDPSVGIMLLFVISYCAKQGVTLVFACIMSRCRSIVEIVALDLIKTRRGQLPVLNSYIPVGADVLGMEDLCHLLCLAPEPESKFRIGTGSIIVKQLPGQEPVRIKYM